MTKGRSLVFLVKERYVGAETGTQFLPTEGGESMAIAQEEIKSIVLEVDGPELSDIQLVEKLIRLNAERDAVKDARKRTIEELAKRVMAYGEELTVGEYRVVAGPKMKTEYSTSTLLSLKNCVTEEQVWRAVIQVPSEKQLKAINEQGGAAAKAVVESARQKIETDVMTVKIKKPRKPRRSRKLL